MIKELEKKPCLLVVAEDENRLPLDESFNCQPVNYKGSCETTQTEEETVGTYLRFMRQSS